ncbi:D-alanyl-D-alanine carboxypeptidase/D-alanyl-D-alanine endopeptidase [Actinomyces sp. zg296]|uniref:D-alanyl-D-alanine carboxypeptidase/D-alanyl-D-alanine endopeptidase n=1 Tax=Actinomyces sp. zg296 TaxID=2609289 RepID=UPI00135B0C97|nr:D-alanyl-D-alanine carboxypeptidase/D-alanyl-D-alanine-endopeptidase [Actinomyces sp. zg296]
MRRITTAALTAATLLVVGGYYGVADALDIVPGPLTITGAGRPAAFPTAASLDGAAGATAAPYDSSAPMPDAGAVAGYASALAADPRVAGASTAVSVVDVTTGRQIAGVSSGTPLTPASTNKLLTAWAALRTLGADHTLSTRTVLSEAPGGTPTVTIIGSGDVLMAEDKGDPNAVIGRAGLGDLARSTAERLKAQGITSVAVALDDTLFPEDQKWSSDWEDGNQSFVAPIQPIMINVRAHESARSYPADPANDAVQAFSKHLQAAGITVSGVSRGRAADGATDLASVSSAPLVDVLGVSLKASDNTMTEVEGRLVAAAAGKPTTFAGATEAVAAQLTADGISMEGVTLKDCSGLAKGNKIPARLLTDILLRAAGPDGGTAGRALIADLPVAALDGTLNDRLVSQAGAGTVRAKTGSLDQTASLAGTVVTANGRLLVFSVIIDGFPSGGLSSARAAMDEDFMVPLAGS